MDRRDYNNNMGPRLDLGLKPNKPVPENEPMPYRRQPASPQQQEMPYQPGNYQPAPGEPYGQPNYSRSPHQAGGQIGQPGQPAQPLQFNRFGEPIYPERADYGNSRQEPDRDMYAEPAYYGEEHYVQAPAPAPAAGPKAGRWLVWLALLLAITAIVVSLFMGRLQSANQATLQADSELVPGATAERVGKLEKDMSSLLLKMVTLEKELDAVKNRSWNPAALGEMNNKIAALQKQVKDMESKLATRGGSATPSGQSAQASLPATSSPAAASSPTQTAQSTNSAPVATPQVQDRAGDKPDPLATRIGAAASASATPTAGQPRHSHKVQAGDTLFSVAQRYQVTTKDLMQWNDMKPDDVLKVGRTLLIY